MTLLASIPFPLRLLAVLVLGLLLFSLLKTFSSLAFYLAVFAIVAWTLVFLSLFYDHGWLNSLSSVPLVSGALGFLTNRNANPNSDNDLETRGELSASDRNQLLNKARSGLASLIGAEYVREQIEQQIVIPANSALARGDDGFATSAPTLVILIAGPRGVGKTTVARHIAQLYAGLGVVKTSDILTVNPQFLRSGRFRSMSEAGASLAKEALDGILLIDDGDWLLRRDNFSDDDPEIVDFGLGLFEIAKSNPHRFVVLVTLSLESEQRLRSDEYNSRWLDKLTVKTVFIDSLQDQDLLSLLCLKLDETGIQLAQESEVHAARLLKEYGDIKGNQFDHVEACRRLAERLADEVRIEGSGNLVTREHISTVIDSLN